MRRQIERIDGAAFGKYSKPHPCNLREVKVFGGQSPEHMTLLWHGGLRNDSTMETFELGVRNAQGVLFPCRYLRVEPIVAHSQNYNGPSTASTSPI